MAQLLNLTFDGADGASIAAPGFVQAHAPVNGWSQISWNRAQLGSGNAGGYAYDDRNGWRYDGTTADAEWSGVFAWDNSNEGRLFFMFRVPGSDLNAQTGYAVSLDQGGLAWHRADNWSLNQQGGASRDHSGGADFGFRIRLVGSRIQARTWAVTGAEPATWDIDVTDATYSGAGYTGPVLFGGNAAAAAAQVELDNLMLTDGAATAVQPPTVSVSTDKATIISGDGRAVFTATTSDPQGQAVTVTWGTTAGAMRDALGRTASLTSVPRLTDTAATVTATATNSSGVTATATATVSLRASRWRTSNAAFRKPQPASDGFVRVSGQRLTLNGKTWRPTGMNLPWSFGWGGSKTPTSAQHQTLFQKMPKGSLFRIWAFGSTPMADIKALIDLARPYGHKFILTLSDYLGATSGEKYVQAAGSGAAFTAGAWKSGGWRDQWLIPMLQAFANDNAVAMWEWMNEPDQTDPNLRSFFDEVGQLARQYDTRHLICTGTAASWGNHAANQAANSSPWIDVTSLHTYDKAEAPSNWVDKDRPDSPTKPILWGESGLTQNEASAAGTTRAAVIANQINSLSSRSDVCGYLYWSGAAPGSFGVGDFEIDCTSGAELDALASTALN